MGKKKKNNVSKQKSRDSNTPEWNHEGLLLSMRHVRNRLLFFVLFAAYSFLSILGTTDKMLYMEIPIKMPLLNIELPLLAFYTVMPLFLLALLFNLLYTFSSHRDYLLQIKNNQSEVLDSLPWGLYEGALLNRDKLHIIIRFIMRLVLYVSPVFVLAAFWFRFADYQHLLITTWHLTTVIISILISFIFRNLLNKKKNVSFKKKYAFIALTLSYFALAIIFISYHFFIFYPLAKAEVSLNDMNNYDKRIESLLGKGSTDNGGSTYEKWFVPKITIYNEVLIVINKEKLEVLQEINPVIKDKALLYSLPQQNRQNRNLRQIALQKCILPNTNFENSQLQGADFFKAKLQGANLSKAQLQGANLSKAQLQGANLSYAQLQGANLSKVQLQGANLYNAQLQGVSLVVAQLQKAFLSSTQLQGTNLSEAQLQGANLSKAQLQGANLSKAQLQGANLSEAQLQGANLSEAQLQGANLSKAQLQGASTQKGTKFINSKDTLSDIQRIDTTLLTTQKSSEVIELIQTHLYKPVFESGIRRIQHSKQCLEKAVGVKPVDWVKSQAGINLGKLTEEEFNKIAKSITEPKARQRMGLPILKKP